MDYLFLYFHSSYGFQGTEKNTYDLSQPGTPLTMFTTERIYRSTEHYLILAYNSFSTSHCICQDIPFQMNFSSTYTLRVYFILSHTAFSLYDTLVNSHLTIMTHCAHQILTIYFSPNRNSDKVV